MKVYKKNKRGFMESINTVGKYKCKGWSDTRGKAQSKKITANFGIKKTFNRGVLK